MNLDGDLDRMKTGFLKSSTPTALNLIVVALAFLVIFAFGIRTIGPGSWWTHLATGRIMAENGGVPQTDQLSFSRAGEAVVAVAWLYDKIVYWLWETAGAPGVTLLHVLAVLAAFAVMAPLARRWCNFPAMALALLLSGWLISFRFDLSPSLLVLIFPATFLLLLYSNTRPVYLWQLIPL